MITAENIKNLFIPILNQPMTVEQVVARIANLVASVAGVVAFFYLLYAGLLYITSGNNPEQARKAQAAIVNVIVGIIIIALSYVIIRIAGSFPIFIQR